MIGSSTCGLTFQLARPNDGSRCHKGRITCLLKGATAAPIAKPAIPANAKTIAFMAKDASPTVVSVIASTIGKLEPFTRKFCGRSINSVVGPNLSRKLLDSSRSEH